MPWQFLVVSVLSLAASTFLISRQKALVEAERERADKNYTQARAAIDEYFMAVSQDTLLNEPGMTGLRTGLLERAEKFFVEITEANDKNDKESARGLANAYASLNQIYSLSGDNEKAIQAANNQSRILSELIQQFPNDIELELARAKSATSRSPQLDQSI